MASQSGMVITAIAFFLCLIACFGLVVSILSRRTAVKARDLQLSEEQRRIEAALSEQKVIRLQNEALTKEILERKNIQEELIYAINHDALTGLHNRHCLSRQVATALMQRRENHRPALLYVDLDRFKSVNDMLGHRLGDTLLVEVAQRLQHCAHSSSTIARINGDEFAILLTHLHNDEQVFRFAQHILNVIEEPITVAETIFSMSASIGMCGIEPSYAQAEDVLRDADTAMYRAKHTGGACVVKYEPHMHEEAIAALEAKMQLKAAIELNQFELYYQPLIDIRNRSIFGVEALIRWNHPTKGLVTPGAFIALAEETGHIIAIGNWVLRQACRDYAELQQSSNNNLLLSVNVSMSQLHDNLFLPELKKIIAETSMDPALLQLEITESVFLSDPDRIGKLIQEIRDMDIKVAFDDFGTGYSSLSYLSRFPVDTLKIDQSFISSLLKPSINSDVVQLIIQLAHTIGMDVSAEGVEDIRQAEILLDYGCCIAQGFLFSKPITFAATKELLRKGLSHRRMTLEVIPGRQ